MDDAPLIRSLLVDEDVAVARRARASLGWATAEVIARWEAEGRLGEFASPDGEDRFWLEVVDLLAAPTPEREERKPLEFLALVEECEVA